MLLGTLTSYIVPLCTWFAGHLQPNPQQHSSSSHHDTTTTTPITTLTSAETGGKPVRLQLRQMHAVTEDARVIFHDVDTTRYHTWVEEQSPGALVLHRSRDLGIQGLRGEGDDYYYSVPATRRVKTYKPPSFEAHAAARTRSLLRSMEASRLRKLGFGKEAAEELDLEGESLGWGEEEIEAPDVERRDVLLLLAKMANNAYVEPGDVYWYDLGEGWNNTYPFGWEPDADGFRGQVFATDDNSTVVVSIKGTSAGMFGGGGPTAKKDKLNDNLLFSCCCARIDWSWTTVCGCYRGGGKCEQDCLENALVEESLFYPIGTNLYNNLTYMYPEANIWIIGHSLGGALASLLGTTFGNPVVTFESPGERLASTRLHLPQPPSLHHVTHVFHTADPIAMGTCNGVLSSCALGGYALETGCHLGRSIIYDTVTHLGWAVDIRTHGIINVIDKILSDEWKPSAEDGREVPEAKAQVDCVECYSWEFGDFPDPKGKKLLD